MLLPGEILGVFTFRKAATWDRQIYITSEGMHASAGFEHANLGTRGQHSIHQTTEAAVLIHQSLLILS
jgi:hypothetical protein